MKSFLINVETLLKSKNLTIPEYQRPYKWSLKNINQLIDDLLLFRNKKAYRIGTIVLHHDKEDKLNIVDGQQRIITLYLFTLVQHKNPCPLGKVRVQRFYRLNSG